MLDEKIISADSHVNEPPKLWSERLDRKYRDQAPKVTTTDSGKLVFIAPGIPPASVSQGFARGLSGEQLKQHLGKGYEAASSGGWDPAARIKDQEVDGVVLEMLYTTLGMRLFAMPDHDLQRACFEVYNNWLAEFCSYDPKRLKGLGLISIADISLAVKELDRCAKSGLAGAMIPIIPTVEHPYSSHEYDPLWQASIELSMPLSLHASTGQRRETQIRIDPKTGGATSTSGTILETVATITYDIQRTLASFIFGGVFKRFPKLRIVSVENGVGWLPYFMSHLDHVFEKFGWSLDDPALDRPSEYMRRHLYATFQEDPVAGRTYELFGENNYMWASDYPHADSTWPNSRKVIERDFGAIPERVRRKITFENTLNLYNLTLN